jgi:mannosyltransferase
MTLVLMAIALALGAIVRLYHLGASDLSPDEAASWAAAAAPGIMDVIRRQAAFNPGKLAAYELLLHGWIGLTGDGVVAMRTLSALLGIAAVALVFWAAREVLLLNESGDLPHATIDQVAAISALIAAVSLTIFRFGREARMYPLLMVAALAETGFLLRAHRRGGALNYAGTALFTGLSIAANFSAVFMLAAQGLWLLLSREGRRRGWPWKPMAALACGAVALAPALLGGAIGNSVSALNEGALNWISPAPWWRVFSFFNRAAGTWPFPILAALALWGAISQWSRLRDAIIFALFWMYAPVLLLFVVSLTLTPLFVERYALSSFVPFVILAALGIGAFDGRALRAAALALALAVSIGHGVAYLRRPPSHQWIHAIAQIRSYSPAAQIVVAPPHGANLIRYYLRDSHYRASEFTPQSCTKSDIFLLWDHALESGLEGPIESCKAGFRHVLFKEKDVTVLTR